MNPPQRTPPACARFIAIEGPIGVGKTSLARRLAASYGADLLLEEADGNPFLPKFYEDPTRHALATQLHFLFNRSRALQGRRQGDLFSPRVVSDFLFAKDRLFARVVLDADEYALYEDIYRRFVEHLPRPALVIYLQASVPTLLRRIARRGIAYERDIDAAYLGRLCEEYVHFFHAYTDTPLLVVNAESLNLVDQEHHYLSLLAEIERSVGGKRHFNPPPPSAA